MKGLLLDQGLPRSTASLLAQSGHTVLHTADIGLAKASDSEILDYARKHDLIVVTLDADFHMLLATAGAASPSVIRLRQQRLNAQAAADVILAVLTRSYESLEVGAVDSATRSLVRVKRLPLPRPQSLPSRS